MDGEITVVQFKQLRTTTPRKKRNERHIYTLQLINTAHLKMYNNNTTSNSSIMKLVKITTIIIRTNRTFLILFNYFQFIFFIILLKLYVRMFNTTKLYRCGSVQLLHSRCTTFHAHLRMFARLTRPTIKFFLLSLSGLVCLCLFSFF